MNNDASILYKTVRSKKFESFLDKLVVIGVSASRKAISGRLIEIDAECGYVTLEHRYGRRTLINVADIEFLAEPGPRPNKEAV